MATPAWNVSGQYYETCNCDFVCLCVPGQLAVRPTKGDCQFAMAFQIERGSYGAVSLDGLGFIILGLSPEEMGKGNWSVGLVTDARATAEQRDAMTAIASGAAGGPMAALSWSVKASNFVDMAATGAKGLNPDAAELRLENTGHPANNTFTLAHASKSHVHALGLGWDDVSGKNNGQYAPFSWKSA
ncbi:MAG: hypothetical protein DMG03_24100 [Acidobacteria bacterium]|nr:MAG: hypothetical protein DMG03_24100 [Acidobacteriota bacterium]